MERGGEREKWNGRKNGSRGIDRLRLIFRVMGHPMAVVGEVLDWN